MRNVIIAGVGAVTGLLVIAAVAAFGPVVGIVATVLVALGMLYSWERSALPGVVLLLVGLVVGVVAVDVPSTSPDAIGPNALPPVTFTAPQVTVPASTSTTTTVPVETTVEEQTPAEAIAEWDCAAADDARSSIGTPDENVQVSVAQASDLPVTAGRWSAVSPPAVPEFVEPPTGELTEFVPLETSEPGLPTFTATYSDGDDVVAVTWIVFDTAAEATEAWELAVTFEACLSNPTFVGSPTLPAGWAAAIAGAPTQDLEDSTTGSTVDLGDFPTLASGGWAGGRMLISTQGEVEPEQLVDIMSQLVAAL